MGRSADTEGQIHGIRKRIPEFLAKNQGLCTANRIAADFMVPWTLANRALRDFALQYECRVDVHTSGESSPQFQFTLPLRQRAGHPSFTFHTLWLFTWTLRSMILLAIDALLLLYGGFFLLVLLIAGLGHWGSPDFLDWRDLKSQFRKWKRSPLKIGQEILALVAGPPYRVGAPSSMLETVYTFLAENAGAATCADVMALTGCTYTDADKFMTWLMLVDDATVHIADDGLLLYVFPEFRRERRAEHTPPVWIWQRHQPGGGVEEYFRRNQNPILFIWFAFGGSIVTSIWMSDAEIHDGMLKLIIADIPLWFSSSVIIISAIRWLVGLVRRNSVYAHELQIDTMRILHDEMRPYSLAQDMERLAAERFGILSNPLPRLVPTVLRGIGGVRTVDQSGLEAIDNPTLRAEWKLSVMARDRILAGAPPPGEAVDFTEFSRS